MVKCIVIILIIGLIASVVMNVMQALSYNNDKKAASDAAAKTEQVQTTIKEGALKDLGHEEPILTGHIALTKIEERDGTALYCMVIPEDGMYLVSVSFDENGKVHFVDVEKKLL